MMSIQANPFQALVSVSSRAAGRQSYTPCALPVLVRSSSRLTLTQATNVSIQQPYAPLSNHRQRKPAAKYQQSSPVCLLGGKDKSKDNNEGSPWKSLEKAVGGLKGKSIEEVLREQMEKQEYYDGGSGKNPPRTGGGGGGSGGDGSGGSEDEGLAGILDETLQVILATLGFIFLYVYIISGEELTRLGKDYIKFLFRGSQSVRLKRAMYKWKRFFQMLTPEEEVDKFWLEKAIINTPTTYDSPEKYRRMLRSELAESGNEY